MLKLLKRGLNVVLDAAWGSSGKGKLCGTLGHENPDIVCSSFGPNAGHTTVLGNGEPIVLKCFPSSAITAKHATIVICPDSAMIVDRFMEEMKMFEGRKIVVHPNCAIVTKGDKENAAITGKHISGTMQGTGHALSRKMLRMKGTQLAKDVLPKNLIGDTSKLIYDCLNNGGTTLFEMSQGFDLSLNHGHEYPYVTSRDVTVGAALNSCGVAPLFLSQVIGCLRTFPIRVGNVDDGWSGPCYSDQHELTWSEIAELSNGPKDLVEKTTVTKRVRRVFSFSIEQVIKFMRMNNPDWLFLNFVQYLDYAANGVKEREKLPPVVHTFINNLERECGVPVKICGTGPKDDQLVYM